MKDKQPYTLTKEQLNTFKQAIYQKLQEEQLDIYGLSIKDFETISNFLDTLFPDSLDKNNFVSYIFKQLLFKKEPTTTTNNTNHFEKILQTEVRKHYINHILGKSDIPYTTSNILKFFYKQRIHCGKLGKTLADKIDTEHQKKFINRFRTPVKKIMNSPTPVIVYVSPSGSRAGSAGVFITLASHIAAMAPSTNIGAAHPVTMGGEEKKESTGLKKRFKNSQRL